MKKAEFTSFLSGVVFAVGLGISGMTRPIKVIGFLDFFGNWDPSLGCVMIGAIGVYLVANLWRRKMAVPLFTAKFSIPARSDLDGRLILGAAIFGAGWGMAGFCPGPAIVSLASGASSVAIFVAAMVLGMYLYSWSSRVEQSTVRAAAPVLDVGADA